MKVKELVAQLLELPQDDDIVLTSMDDDFMCQDFEVHSPYDDGQAQEIILPYYFNDYSEEPQDEDFEEVEDYDNSVQIDRTITKILDYDTMYEIAQITGIDLELQTDIWIGYDDLVHGYPQLIEKNFVTGQELFLLKTKQADYMAFRLDI